MNISAPLLSSGPLHHLLLRPLLARLHCRHHPACLSAPRRRRFPSRPRRTAPLLPLPCHPPPLRPSLPLPPPQPPQAPPKPAIPAEPISADGPISPDDNPPAAPEQPKEEDLGSFLTALQISTPPIPPFPPPYNPPAPSSPPPPPPTIQLPDDLLPPSGQCGYNEQVEVMGMHVSLNPIT